MARSSMLEVTKMSFDAGTISKHSAKWLESTQNYMHPRQYANKEDRE